MIVFFNKLDITSPSSDSASREKLFLYICSHLCSDKAHDWLRANRVGMPVHMYTCPFKLIVDVRGRRSSAIPNEVTALNTFTTLDNCTSMFRPNLDT